MTICPIALAVGCKKCPVFAVCPLTKVIGDQDEADDDKKSKSGTPNRNRKSTK